MIKAVLFDLDNTLIDFIAMKNAASEAAIEAMIKTGLTLDKNKAMKILYQMYEEYGIENQQIFNEFLKKTTGTINYKILAAGVIAYRKTKPAHVKPYKGVIPTLEELKKRGYKLAIVSDAPKEQAYLRLEEMKLAEYFDTIVTFDDTGHKKPHAMPFQTALQELNVKPNEVLHVGDMPERDIAGAKALGMKSALAKYGLTKPLTVKADYELEKIEDLLLITPSN